MKATKTTKTNGTAKVDMSAITEILGSMNAEQLQAILGTKFEKVAEKKEDNTLKVSYSEYKGSPVITLKRGNNAPFSFGLSKAGMILEAMKEIEKFYSKNAK